MQDPKDVRSDQDKYRAIVHEFQAVYRKTWSQPETRQVLANVSV
jgi:hypothetical protein